MEPWSPRLKFCPWMFLPNIQRPIGKIVQNTLKYHHRPLSGQGSTGALFTVVSHPDPDWLKFNSHGQILSFINHHSCHKKLEKSRFSEFCEKVWDDLMISSMNSQARKKSRFILGLLSVKLAWGNLAAIKHEITTAMPMKIIPLSRSCP